MGYAKHYRVHHGANEFARGNQHVNGIESFWSYLKRRFTMFNGVKKSYFHLYLQETVFRYNTRIQKKNLYKEILKLLRKFNSQS
jgi:transposase-like protein